jgi:hypothetical protein
MRLTKVIKDAIAASALEKAGIPAREMAIRSRYAQWAEAIRLRYVTPEALALIEAARAASTAVPDLLRSYAFSPERGYRVCVNVAGQVREVYWNGADRWCDKPDERRICPDSRLTLEQGDPLVDQLYSIDHDAAALRDEKERLNLSIRAVLNRVPTDKKLIEVWPEAVAFIPAAEKAATVNLPALPIADLNRMIGLP